MVFLSDSVNTDLPMANSQDRVRELYSYGRPLDSIAREVGLCVSSVASIVISDLLHMPPERLTLAEASVCHLIDLKRGGYSPSRTELRDPPDRRVECAPWPEASYLP